MSAISLALVLLPLTAITAIQVKHAGDTKEGYSSYIVNLCPGWKALTGAGSAYYFSDARGDRMRIDCIVALSQKELPNSNDVTAQKPPNGRIRVLKRRMGDYSGAMIIMPGGIPHHPNGDTDVTVFLSGVHGRRFEYISVGAIYNHSPSPTEFMCLEKMLGSVRIVN